MEKWNNKGLCIGEHKLKTPIVQGGMGIGISGRRLACAVADEGGIGVISAVGIGYIGTPFDDNEAKKLMEEKGESLNIGIMRQEIRKAKAATKGLLGVNIMVALSEFEATAKAAIEENIDFIFAGAGLPLNLPRCMKEGTRTKLIPIISSPKAAKLIAKRWINTYNYVPDAFVLEGPMAGGHLGFSREQIDNPEYELSNLLTEVKEQVNNIEEETGEKIPIIAAGGIYTGEDISRLLKLGASGVQMATRFVATHECDADTAFKEAYVKCKKEDIDIIKSPVGLPGRAIKNQFIIEAENGKRQPTKCLRNCISTCKGKESLYCISSALVSAYFGKLENGFAFIGANGYRIDKIIKVAELFEELRCSFEAAEKNGGIV